MIEYATISEIGDKEKNEDAVRVFINQPLSTYGFVLADGLGGHGNGDVASAFVTECVGAVIENTDTIGETFLEECFEVSQELLLDEKERIGMPSIKTTMVLMLLSDETVGWGHVGDSRLYHFRGGKQLSRTLDHSVPQMLALSGKIKEREIRHHSDRNRLLRAMGEEWDFPAFEIDTQAQPIKKGDTFLLCSDGFWEWIDEKTISKILKKDLSAFNALQEMCTEVKRNGANTVMDNYSAILIMVR